MIEGYSRSEGSIHNTLPLLYPNTSPLPHHFFISLPQFSLLSHHHTSWYFLLSLHSSSTSHFISLHLTPPQYISRVTPLHSTTSPCTFPPNITFYYRHLHLPCGTIPPLSTSPYPPPTHPPLASPHPHPPPPLQFIPAPHLTSPYPTDRPTLPDPTQPDHLPPTHATHTRIDLRYRANPQHDNVCRTSLLCLSVSVFSVCLSVSVSVCVLLLFFFSLCSLASPFCVFPFL